MKGLIRARRRLNLRRKFGSIRAMQTMSPPARFAGAIVVAVVLGTVAWWILAHQSPAPGQRAFAEGYVWAVRGGALALGALTQAVLFGLALPSMYRPRHAYRGLALACTIVAMLAGVTAGGLALAHQ